VGAESSENRQSVRDPADAHSLRHITIVQLERNGRGRTECARQAHSATDAERNDNSIARAHTHTHTHTLSPHRWLGNLRTHRVDLPPERFVVTARRDDFLRCPATGIWCSVAHDALVLDEQPSKKRAFGMEQSKSMRGTHGRRHVLTELV
jgi:hypothetical protein